MAHRFRREGGGYTKVATANGDVSLEIVFGVFESREAPNAYLLIWHGKKIGFETPYLDRSKDDRGLRVNVLRIERFGESGEVTRKLGLWPVVFASAEQRAEALVDAAEALLTLSNSHKKKHRPRAGYTVVEVIGRILRMEDFDIVEADLGVD